MSRKILYSEEYLCLAEQTNKTFEHSGIAEHSGTDHDLGRFLSQARAAVEKGTDLFSATSVLNQ